AVVGRRADLLGDLRHLGLECGELTLERLETFRSQRDFLHDNTFHAPAKTGACRNTWPGPPQSAGSRTSSDVWNRRSSMAPAPRPYSMSCVPGVSTKACGTERSRSACENRSVAARAGSSS